MGLFGASPAPWQRSCFAFPPLPPSTDTESERAAKELQQQFDKEAEQRREQEACDRALARSLDEGGGDGDGMQLDADSASSHARRSPDARLVRFHQKWKKSGFDMETLLGELTRPGGKKSHFTPFVLPTKSVGFEVSQMNKDFQIKNDDECNAFILDNDLGGRYFQIVITLDTIFNRNSRRNLRDIVGDDAERWTNSFQEVLAARLTATPEQRIMLDIKIKPLQNLMETHGRSRFPPYC